MSRVESEYQAKYLDPLGKAYSDALKEQGEWKFAGIKMSDSFYQDVQNKNYKMCFVIISDGMRFEIGHELFEKIKETHTSLKNMGR